MSFRELHVLPRRSTISTQIPTLYRNAGTYTYLAGSSLETLRRNRVSIALAAVLLSAGIGAAAYYAYLFNELVDKPLSVYPPAVSKSIKVALYYASHGDVNNMLASFKSAIEEGEKAGLHPLSDKVAGIKVECAQLLSTIKGGMYAEKAVKIMERVLDESAAGAEYFEKQQRWQDRSRVLMRAILLAFKVGEMYQDLDKDKNAEDAMVWGTETLLKEIRRRKDNDVDENEEGVWFDNTAVSECLEKLANHFEKTDQFALATPLYLSAMEMIPSSSCHAITLMNNLAATLSQQNLPPLSASSTPQITRAHLLEDAKKWAEKALEIDATIKPPLRTIECDFTRLASTQNLADITAMLGDTEKSRQLYIDALNLAKGLSSQEGVQRAIEGLERLRAR